MRVGEGGLGMNKAQQNNWIFIDKFTKGIKTPEFGRPYTATIDLRNVNGQMHVEGMLSIDELTREDLIEIEVEISRRGFKEYMYRRFKDGIEKTVKRKIKGEK